MARRKSRRKVKRRKIKTIAQRVTALENAIRPKKALRAMKSSTKTGPAIDAGDGIKYIGAYRI